MRVLKFQPNWLVLEAYIFDVMVFVETLEPMILSFSFSQTPNKLTKAYLALAF